MAKANVLLAAVLGSAMVAEVFLEHLHPELPSAALMAVGGASLAWRRVVPLVVVLVLGTVAVAQASFGMSLHTAVTPIIAVLIVSWTVGANLERRQAILGLTLLVCSVWLSVGVDVLQHTDHYQGTDIPWIGTIVLLPGVLGMAFGSRARSLREAEARAARLEREREETVAAERSRIARELHDVIAHAVSVMTVQAGAAEEMLKVDPERAVDPVHAVQQTGRQALVEMKRLVGMLRAGDEEVGLDPQPGLADLPRLIEQMRGAGLPIELEIAGRQRTLPIGVDLSAYRVVQEALTNALKHGNGTEARVGIDFGERELSIEVANAVGNARGVDDGHGLVGMRERIAIFGGTLVAGPEADGGFAVRVKLPLEAPA